MLIDWNATLTGIALIAAIISPIITTVISNRFQIKLKKLELIEQRKLDVIDGYLKSVSDASYTLGIPDEFAQYKSIIFLYAPENIRGKVKELNKAVEHTCFDENTSALLYDVAQALRTENKIG